MEVSVMEQWQPAVEAEAEEVVEVGFQRRQHSTVTTTTTTTNGTVTHQKKGVTASSENSIYLDQNGGALEDLDFSKVLSNAAKLADNQKPQPKTESSDESIQVAEQEEDVFEEEVVELEFEKAVPKLHTHTMHCPKCDSHITRVVLRRRIKKPTYQRQEEPRNLLGCLSCFSLFLPSGNGRFNPFPIFSKEDAPPINPSIGKALPTNGSLQLPRGTDIRINVTPTTQTVPTTQQEDQTQREQQGSISMEILKSIVYGGLMEVIASLSIVASAAASDATTLNIMALAIANLIGGIIIIWHNLWELRDDCYKANSQEANEKYKELLGRVNHFPLHLIFAAFSFLVFGMIPPMAFGFAINQTNDMDYSMVAVAVVSLVCVGLLGIFKAYINRCSGFFGYVKTVSYYVTTAVTVSGVSYVTGNLVTRLLQEVGWFEASSGVAMSLLPNANPSFASY